MNTVKILYGSWSELDKLNLSINHYGERLLKDLLAKLEMLMTRFEIRNLTRQPYIIESKLNAIMRFGLRFRPGLAQSS